MFDIQNTKRLPSGQMALLNAEYATYKHSTPDDSDYDAACDTVHFKTAESGPWNMRAIETESSVG